MLAKILVTLTPARAIPYQKRGKYYLFLEVTSQLHRQLAPLQPWLMYLLNSNGDGGGAGSIPNKVLGVFLTAAYMVVKGKIFVKALKSWKDACNKLLQSTRYITINCNHSINISETFSLYAGTGKLPVKTR